MRAPRGKTWSTRRRTSVIRGSASGPSSFLLPRDGTGTDGGRSGRATPAPGRPLSPDGCVALRVRTRRRAGGGVLGRGRAGMVERLGGRGGDLERARIGVAAILGRADDRPPGDEPRVLAGGDHRREPVEGGVRVIATQALDERRHGVVV